MALLLATTAARVKPAPAAHAPGRCALNRRMVKLNDRMVWFTGSMESYSRLMLRLEAKRQGVRLIWWDPSEKGWPKTGPDGADATPEVIRIGMHPTDRDVIPPAWE